jgi:hypothetical protein
MHSLSRLCTSIHSSALTQCIHLPCVHHVHLDPSIAPLYLLRYSTADLPTRCRHSGQTHHRPRRTLRPTNRNSLEPAQVERHVPSTRNINSDSQSKVATSVSIVERRGERNVPRRYLKDAEWHTDKYLGEGYYVADPDEDDTFCTVDFSFDTLQWGLTEPIEGQYQITHPIPVKYGLRIFDEERQDRSRWGPLDGSTNDEEPLAQTFKFGSNHRDTPDPDITIPQNEAEEQALLHWLNSFPHTLPDPTSIPSMDYLRWLLECHKSQQLPLSLQQAHWAELLELEYPPEQGVAQPISSETSLEVEEDLEEDRCMVEDLLMPDNPRMETPPIQQTLEEGEILLMEDFPTNY